jgi:peptidoglycan/LPS O-acetylase OafA/YrhL
MTLVAVVTLAATTELTFRWLEEPARAWMRRLSFRSLIAQLAPLRSSAK